MVDYARNATLLNPGELCVEKPCYECGGVEKPPCIQPCDFPTQLVIAGIGNNEPCDAEGNGTWILVFTEVCDGSDSITETCTGSTLTLSFYYTITSSVTAGDQDVGGVEGEIEIGYVYRNELGTEIGRRYWRYQGLSFTGCATPGDYPVTYIGETQTGILPPDVTPPSSVTVRF